MKFEIAFSKVSLKELTVLPKKQVSQIIKSIESLSQEPRPAGCKKLKGQDEDIWRIRSGDYRILYVIEDTIHIITIRKIGHRKDIYE